MESLLSRSPLSGSSSSVNIHPVTRKKASFMAFKDKISASSDTNYSAHKQSLPSSPLSLGYFDRYPRRPSSSPATPSHARSRRRTTSPQRSEQDDVSFTEPDRETETELKSSTGRCYKFPNSDSTHDISTVFNVGEATPCYIHVLAPEVDLQASHDGNLQHTFHHFASLAHPFRPKSGHLRRLLVTARTSGHRLNASLLWLEWRLWMLWWTV